MKMGESLGAGKGREAKREGDRGGRKGKVGWKGSPGRGKKGGKGEWRG